MSIVISITKLPDGAVDTKSTHTFAQQGGTIGRSPDNDWILEDPEKYISSQHSQITCENGQYYITDLSTNGTFSNGAAEPIGKGNTVKLNDGDKFALGDYEFLTSNWLQEEQQIPNSNDGPFAESAPIPSSLAPSPIMEDIPQQDYFASARTDSSSVDGFASPFTAHVDGTDSLFSPEPMETDPLAALDSARSIPSISSSSPFDSNVFPATSQTDQADPMQQSVSWPNSTIESGGIPENWDLNSTPVTAPAPVQLNKANFMSDEIAFDTYSGNNLAENNKSQKKKVSLEKANKKILAEIEILKKQAQKQALQQQIEKNTQQPNSVAQNQKHSSPRAVTTNDQSLIDALGLSDNDLSDQKVVEINQIVGELVRETITGMMQVLSSRSTIKNEFRMNVTTIQPVENNPLKFSANINDAMQNMFVKEGNAYKKPVEAIKEGFEGIAEHQIAILAGIRTAFKGVIDRFDPVALEKRFEQFNKPGIIPGMNKTKNWDSYRSYYKELVDDMDNSFQHLFGYEFVQAYEEQLQKLMLARKTNN